jgi:hypothetical protein
VSRAGFGEQVGRGGAGGWKERVPRFWNACMDPPFGADDECVRRRCACGVLSRGTRLGACLRKALHSGSCPASLSKQSCLKQALSPVQLILWHCRKALCQSLVPGRGQGMGAGHAAGQVGCARHLRALAKAARAGRQASSAAHSHLRCGFKLLLLVVAVGQQRECSPALWRHLQGGG